MLLTLLADHLIISNYFFLHFRGYRHHLHKSIPSFSLNQRFTQSAH